LKNYGFVFLENTTQGVRVDIVFQKVVCYNDGEVITQSERFTIKRLWTERAKLLEKYVFLYFKGRWIQKERGLFVRIDKLDNEFLNRIVKLYEKAKYRDNRIIKIEMESITRAYIRKRMKQIAGDHKELIKAIDNYDW